MILTVTLPSCHLCVDYCKAPNFPKGVGTVIVFFMFFPLFSIDEYLLSTKTRKSRNVFVLTEAVAEMTLK